MPPIDLSPARWIWFPSERTLANTFILFRRVVEIPELLTDAAIWISADSRYRLTVDGRRVGWGPAPCDPRYLEADPYDLTPWLTPGPHVIGVEVLHYGIGEGTWALGKPGLLARIDLTDADGLRTTIATDADWSTCVDRAHPPGQYRRWYLRALQEVFDSRLHPHGWDMPDYVPGPEWLPAQILDGAADKPAICTHYDRLSYGYGGRIDPALCELRARPIGPMRESQVPAALAASGRVQWRRDPRDWFEFRTPDSFTLTRDAAPIDPAAVQINAADEGVYLTFELPEQMIGWPYLRIEAPAGAVVELMTQEAHDPAAGWLDTHFYHWSRFICRGGAQWLEPFDYESLRWFQAHVHGAVGPVRVLEAGVRRRVYDWPQTPHIHLTDSDLQRLIDASLNTVINSAQETIVDGMGRERQQYSGDIGHELIAVRAAFGETRLAARFLDTWSQGITQDGYFLDCWPGYDRLWRIPQRQIEATPWGPLLDHGIGFGFDCWDHYLDTGDLDAIAPAYPRLLRFADYLAGLRCADGLLPVEDLGVPVVWMDHDAYRQQRHKQCAFNLYAAAMLEAALSPLALAFGQAARAADLRTLGESLRAAGVARFWDAERGLFINNLPWLSEEDAGPRCDDRALATALLYDQLPDAGRAVALRVLADRPAMLGISYPANAIWRCAALIRGGYVNTVLAEYRTDWANMESVLLNNALSEQWHANPDGTEQWSHAPMAPLNTLLREIAGIRPTEPGFAACIIAPQPGDIGPLELTYHTVRGPIQFSGAPGVDGVYRAMVTTPPGCRAIFRGGAEVIGAVRSAGEVAE